VSRESAARCRVGRPAAPDRNGEPSATQRLANPERDGRTLFVIGPDGNGTPILTWLVVGHHDIHQ
jgi:hypothetical protein